MKAIIYKYSLIGLAIVTFFTSCTENIDLKLDSTYAHLVIDGAITTDTTKHRIILMKSGDALNKLPIQYISDANVSITDGTDTFKLKEHESEKGIYETDSTVFGVPGKTYTLNVSNVDVNDDDVSEKYWATCKLKKIATIDSINLFYQKFDSQTDGWMINLFGYDIGGRNYYLTKAFKNNLLLTDSLKEYGKAVNSGFEGKYYPGFSVYFLNSNKTDEVLQEEDTITLELDGITEEYYNFIDAFQQEYQPKVPIFSGPSSNVPTNIEPKGSGVGFFAAYSVERATVVFKK